MGRVGLVFGGGGVVGHAFHAGVLAALAEIGFDPRAAEVILGTSAGSWVGVYLRAGLAAADLAAATSGEPCSPAGERLFEPVRAAGPIPPPTPVVGWERLPLVRTGSPALLARLARRPWEARLGIVAAAALPAGRRSTACFVAGLDPLFPGGAWPERSLWITAIRLDTGGRVVFGAPGAPTVSVGQAVAASCAMPSFFEPLVVEGVRHADGGCHSPTNLDLLAGCGLDLVIVSSPMSGGDGRQPRRRLHGLELRSEATRVRRSGTEVIAIEPDAGLVALMGRDSMDETRRRPVVAATRELARRRFAAEPGVRSGTESECEKAE